MKIRDLVPPGYDAKKMIRWLSISLGVVFIVTLTGFMVYFQENLALVKRIHMSDGSVKMPDINIFMGGRFILFFRYFMVCGYLMILFFRSFHSHSKSVYTMKRINDKWELPLRIVSLPLRFTVLALIAAVTGMLICKNVYFSLTPDELKPAFDGMDFWRILL